MLNHLGHWCAIDRGRFVFMGDLKSHSIDRKYQSGFQLNYMGWGRWFPSISVIRRTVRALLSFKSNRILFSSYFFNFIFNARAIDSFYFHNNLYSRYIWAIWEEKKRFEYQIYEKMTFFEHERTVRTVKIFSKITDKTNHGSYHKNNLKNSYHKNN